MTLQQNSNSYTGITSPTTTTSDSLTLTESGSYLPSGTSYSISENNGTSSTVVGTQNAFTGADDPTTETSTGSTLTETGSNSNGSYTTTETVTGSSSMGQEGNDFTGDYTSDTNSSSTTTTQESNGFAAGSSAYTETSIQSVIASETGNALTGDYELARTTTTSTTLTDSGSNGAGSFSVGSTDNGTQTRSESGNHLDGDYSASTGSTDSYNWTESDGGEQPFTLTATGATSDSGTDTGNTVSGLYSTALSGSDTYTLVETGTATGGDYDQTVSGSENYSQVETGNSVEQTVNVSDGGSGTYTMTDSGPGATSSGGSGSYGYTLTEVGNWQAGSVSQSATGEDRYGLLQQFNNVADTSSGSGPGHLDFHPFGAAFVDPPTLSQPPGQLVIEPPAYQSHEQAEKWAKDNVIRYLGDTKVTITWLDNNRMAITFLQGGASERAEATSKLHHLQGDDQNTIYTQAILEALVGYYKNYPYGRIPDRAVVAGPDGNPVARPQPLSNQDKAAIDADYLVQFYLETGRYNGKGHYKDILQAIQRDYPFHTAFAPDSMRDKYSEELKNLRGLINPSREDVARYIAIQMMLEHVSDMAMILKLQEIEYQAKLRQIKEDAQRAAQEKEDKENGIERAQMIAVTPERAKYWAQLERINAKREEMRKNPSVNPAMDEIIWYDFLVEEKLVEYNWQYRAYSWVPEWLGTFF